MAEARNCLQRVDACAEMQSLNRVEVKVAESDDNNRVHKKTRFAHLASKALGKKSLDELQEEIDELEDLDQDNNTKKKKKKRRRRESGMFLDLFIFPIPLVFEQWFLFFSGLVLS